MKAVRLYGQGDLRVEEIAPPGPPDTDWVRIAVTAAGICGSDLHNFRTGQWISRSPSTPGHEFTGVVTEIGNCVVDFVPGDRVVADSRVWCGQCAACQGGRRHLCANLGFVGEVCDGGFAEEVNLPARLLHRVDASFDPRSVAMTEPLAVALHAVRRLRPDPGCPVLVVGCGPIGGLAALLLARTHDGAILVTDRNGERAGLVAERTGSHIVALEREAILAATGGLPLLHAIDATGSTAALKAMIASVDAGARLALVGIFHEHLELDPNLLVEREIALVGCHAFAEEMQEAIGLLPQLSGQLLGLIGAEVTLDEVPAAYSHLASGTARGLKTIVRPFGHRGEQTAMKAFPCSFVRPNQII